MYLIYFYQTFHTCAEYVFFMKNIFNLKLYICIPFYYFIGSKAVCALRGLWFLYKSSNNHYLSLTSS